MQWYYLWSQKLLRNSLESILQMKESKGMSSSKVTYLIARLVFTTFVNSLEALPYHTETLLGACVVYCSYSQQLLSLHYMPGTVLVRRIQQWKKQMKSLSFFDKEDKYKKHLEQKYTFSGHINVSTQQTTHTLLLSSVRKKSKG